MTRKKEKCSICGRYRKVKNRTHKICDSCYVSLRYHKQKYIFESLTQEEKDFVLFNRAKKILDENNKRTTNKNTGKQ